MRLARNRDFVLLQAGQLLSSAGTQSTTIVYSLLALGLTGSPAKAGLVGFARGIALVLFQLPAGALVDRWDRRRTMIVCDIVRATAAVVVREAGGPTGELVAPSAAVEPHYEMEVA